MKVKSNKKRKEIKMQILFAPRAELGDGMEDNHWITPTEFSFQTKREQEVFFQGVKAALGHCSYLMIKTGEDGQAALKLADINNDIIGAWRD